MKKLPAFLNTPARLVVAVVLLILLAELLIMMLVEDVITPFITPELWHFIDPILLIAIVSPAFYLLIFRPMRAQQAGLERQLDELRRFQSLSIGRELRMKELVGEIAALRTPLSAGPAGNMPVTSGSPEAARDAAAQPATTQPAEQDQRSALLFMLEDLEAAHQKIEQAHQEEWTAALDVVNDPIFLHDKNFRILRCNKAYQQRAGIPFHDIIGQTYYEVFPKTGAPLPRCLRAMEEEEEEEEVTSGEAIYRSRSFSIHDEQGAHLYSVHILEDITESRRAEAALHESEERFRAIFEGALDGILLVNAETRLLSISNPTMCRMLGYSPDEIMQLGVPDIHPQQDLPHVIEQFGRQLRGEIPLAADIPVKRKDGSVFYADIKSTPVNFGGKTYLLGMFRDITERKQAEQALYESEKLYRSLFENILNGFAYCRMIFEQDQPQDFIYLNVNAAFETLTGLKNVVDKKVSEVIPGIRQSDPGLFEIYGRVSLSGKPERFEIYVEALQQWFWISVYSPAKGYFVAVFDVITERKLAEAKLAEQVDDLRRWHDATIGREMRVLDLKHEVNELLGQTGQPPRYPSAESDDPQEK